VSATGILLSSLPRPPVERPVVLVAGLLGAGCTSVAQELSKALGWRVVNSELIIREIASEKRLSFSALSALARDGEIDLEDVIRSVALDYVNEGNVIIEGRTAFMVLDRPVLLKVFLYADEGVRAERVAQRRRVSLEEAREEVRRSDEDRERLVRRLHRKSMMDPSLYDLMINTTGLTFKEVASLIEAAIKWKQEVHRNRGK